MLGRVARQIAALWHQVSIRRTAGSRNAHASRESVGEVRSALVIAMDPERWIVLSCLMIFVDTLFEGSVFDSGGGPHHISAP